MIVVMIVSMLAADAPAPTPSEAAVLFDQGRAAFKADDFEKACPAFARSYELEPVLGTLLNWATCLEKQKRFASAWLRFNDAVTWAQRTHEAEREQFARDHAKTLRPSVSWLAFTSSVEVEVLVDDKPVHVSSIAVPVPVDVGSHRARLEQSGFEPWSSTVEVQKAGQTVTVVVPAKRVVFAEQLAPPPMPPVSTSSAPPVTRQAAPGVQTETHMGRLTGGVTLIISGSLISIAAGAGLAWSFSTYDLLQKQRAGSPNPELNVSREDFARLQWVPAVSWVGVGVGAAALITGIVLATTSKSVVVSPTVGPNGTSGLVVSGRF